jgi:hypothetical protein
VDALQMHAHALDRERFVAALERAGVAATASPADEPVGALARRYQSDLEAGEAAAELGLSTSELAARLRQLGVPAGLGLEPLLVDGGGVKRAVWERRFAEIVRGLRVGAPVVPALTARTAERAAAESVGLLRSTARLMVSTKTQFFTPSQLENELRKRPEFVALGVTIVRDRAAADLEVVVDRPLFTYTYTFTVTDTRTSAVVASGKLTAFDGSFAAPKIAKELVRWLGGRR